MKYGPHHIIRQIARDITNLFLKIVYDVKEDTLLSEKKKDNSDDIFLLKQSYHIFICKNTLILLITINYPLNL